MTREEEIMNAIDAIIPILPPNNGRTYEQALMATGFEAGADWADEHPVNAWHDASEVPEGPYIVLCDGLDNRQWVVEWLYIDMSYANWQDYVERISVSRWAYISDLLPKGGEK